MRLLPESEINKLPFSGWKNALHKLVILHPVTFRNKQDFNTHRLLRAIDNNTLLSKLPVSEQAQNDEVMLNKYELIKIYGNYPRILGKYVREEKVLTLEDAIRKMTSAVATRLSIADRGVLRPGVYADVVVFDPATVADRATFERPHQISVGIRQVFINGVAVVQDGVHTGAKPGRAVRGPGWNEGR